MATKGKRTANRTALKRRTAAQRKRATARAKTTRQGRAKATRGEVKRVVPRMTRAQG